MTGTKQKEFHDVANIFPLMEGSEFSELVADIKKNGLRESIWLYEDKIIDGRNRYRACIEAGVEPKFRKWLGDGSAVPAIESLTAFVVSLNLHRRHLTESQRAMIGARIKPLFEAEAKKRQAHGQTAPGKTLPPNLAEALGDSRDDAARAVKVSHGSINSASAVLKDGSPNLINAVDAGSISVSAAADLSNLPKEEQDEVMKKDKKEINKEVKKIREEKKESRNNKSEARRVTAKHEIETIDDNDFQDRPVLRISVLPENADVKVRIVGVNKTADEKSHPAFPKIKPVMKLSHLVRYLRQFDNEPIIYIKN